MSEPIAFMRRCAFDKNEGTRGNRPSGWHFHATSLGQLLPDDVPLYAAPVADNITSQSAEIAAFKAKLAEAIEALRAFAVLGQMLDGPFSTALFRDDQPVLGSGKWLENGEPRNFTFADLRRAAQVVAKHGVGR